MAEMKDKNKGEAPYNIQIENQLSPRLSPNPLPWGERTLLFRPVLPFEIDEQDFYCQLDIYDFNEDFDEFNSFMKLHGEEEKHRTCFNPKCKKEISFGGFYIVKSGKTIEDLWREWFSITCVGVLRRNTLWCMNGIDIKLDRPTDYDHPCGTCSGRGYPLGEYCSGCDKKELRRNYKRN